MEGVGKIMGSISASCQFLNDIFSIDQVGKLDTIPPYKIIKDKDEINNLHLTFLRANWLRMLSFRVCIGCKQYIPDKYK